MEREKKTNKLTATIVNRNCNG